jgi:F0F1-type ATP synthase membrane subunit b/b'
MTDFPLSTPPSSSPAGRDDRIERLEEQANRTARDFESGAASLGDRARETRDEALREGSKLAGRVKEHATTFAEDQKRSGTEKLGQIAGAVKRAADDLEQASPKTAGYVRSAAESVEDFSASLRDKKVEDIASDARNFARRQPWLVFGGAVLAGLAVTRFLKSARPRGESDRNSSYGSEFGGRHDSL